MIQTKIGRGTALAVAAAVALAACGKKPDAAQAAADAAPAVMNVGPEGFMVVQSGDISSGPAISGNLKAENEATVRAQIGGSVLQTYAEKGQPVSAGAMLARLDDAALRDQMVSAQSGVRAAQSAADVARRNTARLQELNSAGAIADRDVENARSQSSAAQAQLADARSRLASAQKQASYTVVRSPISGVVSDRPVNAGDVVQPGAALYTVVDPRSMRLEASVPAEQVGQVRVGAPVQFTVTGYAGRTFTGKVQRVNPAADPTTGQVQVYVAIPNDEGRLVGGLFAQGRVLAQARSGIAIPITAVDQKGVGPTVSRVRGGKVEQVRVTLGVRDEQGERVEVTQGLAAGDTILVGAALGITPNTPVRVGTPAAAR
ncbi:MAG TPA: efflux RND transporter periplasmic adaptor subunit [Longimicrobiaceae bacterium]|jgi:RND family efflux transporter MFP subunit|nr:efflux RND transporter periplasmic adaptor subunit [Longimicrobiaceae bacterium]